jgi:hypothetical protein
MPVGLAFIRPGAAGIVLVIGVQSGLVTCMGPVNPVIPRIAIAVAGLLMPGTPLLLPRRERTSQHEPELARTAA